MNNEKVTALPASTMKLYGYVWTKDKHEAKFFWTELEARDVQKNFGGEIVPVYK